MKWNNTALPYLGGGWDDVAEASSACTADVCISQKTAPYCKTDDNKEITQHWLSQKSNLTNQNLLKILQIYQLILVCLDDSFQTFLPCDAMHPQYYHGPVSVCLSQVDVLLKRLNVGGSHKHHTIAQRVTLVFWCQKSPRNSTGVTRYEGVECRCGGSKSVTFNK